MTDNIVTKLSVWDYSVIEDTVANDSVPEDVQKALDLVDAWRSKDYAAAQALQEEHFSHIFNESIVELKSGNYDVVIVENFGNPKTRFSQPLRVLSLDLSGITNNQELELQNVLNERYPHLLETDENCEDEFPEDNYDD